MAEGADFLMVKPGIAYLDVARMVKQKVSWDCVHVCLKEVGVVMVMCVLGGGGGSLVCGGAGLVMVMCVLGGRGSW